MLGLARLVAVAAVTLIYYIPLRLGLLVLPAGSRRRARWQSRIFRGWSRWMRRGIGIRLEVHGEAPAEPYLLVANHLSYVDIIALGAEVGGTFVAKAEVSDWPVIGHICRSVGTVFVDRGSKRDLLRVSDVVRGALDRGRGVILFPEGTTGPGDGFLPFRGALLEVAARSSYPVYYACLSYSTPRGAPRASQTIPWVGDAGFGDHLMKLLRIRSHRAVLTFGPRPIVDSDRKRLAELLIAAMSEIFEPTL